MTGFWMLCDKKNPTLQWDQNVTQRSSVFFVFFSNLLLATNLTSWTPKEPNFFYEC